MKIRNTGLLALALTIGIPFSIATGTPAGAGSGTGSGSCPNLAPSKVVDFLWGGIASCGGFSCGQNYAIHTHYVCDRPVQGSMCQKKEVVVFEIHQWFCDDDGFCDQLEVIKIMGSGLVGVSCDLVEN